MGKFEDNAGKHMLQLEDKITALWRERHNLDWGHECDCEFCDRVEDVPEETEKRAAEIDQEIKDIEAAQRRLQQHCNLHGVQVFTAKQKRDKLKTSTT